MYYKFTANFQILKIAFLETLFSQDSAYSFRKMLPHVYPFCVASTTPSSNSPLSQKRGTALPGESRPASDHPLFFN